MRNSGAKTAKPAETVTDRGPGIVTDRETATEIVTETEIEIQTETATETEIAIMTVTATETEAVTETVTETATEIVTVIETGTATVTVKEIETTKSTETEKTIVKWIELATATVTNQWKDLTIGPKSETAQIATDEKLKFQTKGRKNRTDPIIGRVRRIMICITGVSVQKWLSGLAIRGIIAEIKIISHHQDMMKVIMSFFIAQADLA